MKANLIRGAGVGLLVLATACGGSGPDTDRVALAAAGAPADTLVVYKSPTCGCCSNWVDHIEENGFAVVTHDISDVELTATKRRLGVPAGRVSCHTATVRGYTIEGHVPADLVRRLLDEKPDGVLGLAVPGMPIGSPGMEGLIRQEYDVLTFDAEGNVAIYDRR
ncbi:MAG TPA: DUF411 domain-containing protein [Longimicrobiales bacterium]